MAAPAQDDLFLGRNWWVETVDSTGHTGGALALDTDNYTADDNLVWPVTPFWDGRQHLQQNLNFLLRAPNAESPFGYVFGDTPYTYQLHSFPQDYAYASFYVTRAYMVCLDEYDADPLMPFKDNYFFRNFVFSATNLTTAGRLDTGIDPSPYPDYDCDGNFIVVPYMWAPAFQFPLPTDSAPIPALLSASDTQWTYFNPLATGYDLESINITDTFTNYYMTNATVNWFGLPFISAKFAYNNGNGIQIAELDAGGGIPAVGGYVYPETAQPELRTVDHYFARPGVDPLPGNAAFSPTNETPALLVASFAQSPFYIDDNYYGPFQLAGYAKQRLLNGYSGVYGYLGQYFEGAYIIDTNGAITTNRAGLLSPYGEFFPTNVGPAALITMPNWDGTGGGTAVVQVVSINVDANHDGMMDFSFGSPDQTSEARPFRFWINDDDDDGDTTGDDIPGYPATHGQTPNGEDNHVNGVRDLVDFFPVYLNVQRLLQDLPPGANVSIWLKQSDSALNYIDPGAYDTVTIAPTNCLVYLTDTNVACGLGGTYLPSAPTYQITADGTMLDSYFVSKIRDEGKGMLLMEARKATTKPLVMEVHDGTNVIATCPLFVSITPVDQMFRHKNLMPDQVSTNLHAPAERLIDASVPNEPPTNEKNFVFLHGYNVNPEQAQGAFSETFKRLYWSGSHAKFYGVTWYGSDTQGDVPVPGGSTINLPTGVTINYHTNVYHALQAAPHLAEFLSTLDGATTISAHSLGNMVVLSAICDYYGPVSNYFMLDAAVAMETIDSGTAPINDMKHSEWRDYDDHLYAANWHELFGALDPRSKLSWNSCFTNFHGAQLYNFYSSGEEVLREWSEDPPTNVLSAGAQIVVDAIYLQSPASSFVWVWQEKAKGRAESDNLLGSTHGGWKFNTNYASLTVDQANALQPDQLQTNAFFDFGSTIFTADLTLEGDFGNVYANTYRDRIRSDAVPALSWVIGSHALATLDQPGEPRNFDIMDFENSWPRQSGSEAFKWHHSDFREIAYTYTYKLFNKFVAIGNLK